MADHEHDYDDINPEVYINGLVALLVDGLRDYHQMLVDGGEDVSVAIVLAVHATGPDMGEYAPRRFANVPVPSQITMLLDAAQNALQETATSAAEAAGMLEMMVDAGRLEQRSDMTYRLIEDDER